MILSARSFRSILSAMSSFLLSKKPVRAGAGAFRGAALVYAQADPAARHPGGGLSEPLLLAGDHRPYLVPAHLAALCELVMARAQGR